MSATPAAIDGIPLGPAEAIGDGGLEPSELQLNSSKQKL